MDGRLLVLSFLLFCDKSMPEGSGPSLKTLSSCHSQQDVIQAQNVIFCQVCQLVMRKLSELIINNATEVCHLLVWGRGGVLCTAVRRCPVSHLLADAHPSTQEGGL